MSTTITTTAARSKVKMSSSVTADAMVNAVRAAFPALGKNQDYVYSENAGGSQVLGTVAHKLTSYLLDTNVQMGNYPLAHRAKARVDQGYAATALLLGPGVTTDEVLFGASATQLVENLSRMIEQTILTGAAGWQEGDEIVVSQADHETNRGAWIRLAERRGLVVRHWTVRSLNKSGGARENEVAKRLDVADLALLLNERTRLVAFTACSNLLGAFVDVRGATDLVRERTRGRAWTCVDAVAYAPHRRVRPLEMGADFVFWSWYKVYGPHIGSMYLSKRAQAGILTRMNHHFLHDHPGTYPFQPSSSAFESIYAISAVVDYLVALGQAAGTSSSESGSASGPGPGPTDLVSAAQEIDHVQALQDEGRRADLSALLDKAYEWIAAHETKLLQVLMPRLAALQDKDLLKVVGDGESRAAVRAPTVAFVGGRAGSGAGVSGGNAVGSAELHRRLTASDKLGAQQGHMYAYDLVKAVLGSDANAEEDNNNAAVADGVVRISLVHYNSVRDAGTVAAAIEEAVSV